MHHWSVVQQMFQRFALLQLILCSVQLCHSCDCPLTVLCSVTADVSEVCFERSCIFGLYIDDCFFYDSTSRV